VRGITRVKLLFLGSSDTRVKNFTYIDAVKKLPTNFTDDEVRPILIRAGSRFAGRLRLTFIVLDDDSRVGKKKTATAVADPSSPVSEDEDEESRFVTVQGSRKRRPDSRVENLAKKTG